MADRAALAIRREKAIAELTDAARRMAEHLGISTLAVERRHKRPEVEAVDFLERIAAFMQGAALEVEALSARLDAPAASDASTQQDEPTDGLTRRKGRRA